MIVAFLHVGQQPTLANIMLQSVRRHMPGVECVQLTDTKTPAIEGCTVVREHWDGNGMNLWKMRRLAGLEGEVLVLDTDLIVQADLRGVFSLPFDVALTWRDGPIYDAEGQDITKVMPINTGVMWSRAPEFWRQCVSECEAHEYDGWYADQLSVARVARHFNVLRLHCDNFNFTPNRGDSVAGRYVLHYKGKRKDMMMEQARIEGYLLDTD